MDATRIEKVVTPALEAYALELDALEIVNAGKRSVVRIIVDGDGPKGRGPLLDEISGASLGISHALDDSGVMGERPYTLEVSSRGTSRPLSKPQHWRRNAGRLVTARLEDGTQITGRIQESDETSVVLDVDGATMRHEFAALTKPLIQVELNRPKDPDLDDVEVDDTQDEE